MIGGADGPARPYDLAAAGRGRARRRPRWPTASRPGREGCSGATGYEGALVLPRTRSVHTVGMRFPIDVAFCDKDMVVVGVTRLPPWRISLPRRRRPVGRRGRGRCVRAVGASQVGDQLELR